MKGTSLFRKSIMKIEIDKKHSQVILRYEVRLSKNLEAKNFNTFHSKRWSTRESRRAFFSSRIET